MLYNAKFDCSDNGTVFQEFVPIGERIKTALFVPKFPCTAYAYPLLVVDGAT
jgi:hypothetical protein